MSVEQCNKIEEYNKWIKWISFSALAIAAIILACVAFHYGDEKLAFNLPNKHLRRRFSNLSVMEWVVITAPIIAFGISKVTHYLDRQCKGGGIRHVVTSLKTNRYATDASVLAATMSKQSVLAAIAAILLGIIQGVKSELEKQASNSDILQSPLAAPDIMPFPLVAAELSTIGFLISILLLLISMKCYDYSSRFNFHPVYKITLISKGLDLDILSWYALLFSFALGIASMSESISILLSFMTGFLLWWYYFIYPIPKVAELENIREAESTENSCETESTPDEHVA
ncbi:MAG TPA: hypothetical protein VF721_14655 [Pyrinomonadaceae bacterium]|jgi:hypothetical protein